MRIGAHARTPPGLRIYAVGDIHGRADLLAGLQGRIARDLARRPPADWRVIYLGDYCDRGPDTAGVLELLAVTGPADRSYFLRGNHDDQLSAFLADPETPSLFPWLECGGLATIASYGIDLQSIDALSDPVSRNDLRHRLLAAMPPSHVGFLESLPHLLRLGDYVFVHAGIRPGVDLKEQRPRDLMYIRDAFLTSRAEHGAVIVHGHSPVQRAERYANRIAIDTGAGHGGCLTCLVLEDAEVGVLSVKGPKALPLMDVAEIRAA